MPEKGGPWFFEFAFVLTTPLNPTPTRNEETLFFGTRECAPGLLNGLGFGTPAGGLGVGRPATTYLDSLAIHAATFNGEPGDDRRARRSVEHLADRQVESFGLVYGSNATLQGPIQFDPKRSRHEVTCHDLIQAYTDAVGTDAEDAREVFAADVDNEQPHLDSLLNFLESSDRAYETMFCLGLTHAPASTCVTHPMFRYANFPSCPSTWNYRLMPAETPFLGTI